MRVPIINALKMLFMQVENAYFCACNEFCAIMQSNGGVLYYVETSERSSIGFVAWARSFVAS